MSKPKGGRGHTAPYETTHVRIPVPLKQSIEKMIESYRESLVGGEQATSELHQVSLEEAIDIAKSILKQKKSARQSIEKLLTSLYNQEVKL